MRKRLVRNTLLVTVMVLVVLVTPVILLLQRATEDELRDRLAAQATSISSTLAEPLLNNQPIDQERLVDLLIEGDRAEIRARNGDLIAAVGPIINDSIHATVAGAADTRIDVSTSRANVRRRFNGQLSLLGVLAAGGVLLAAVLASIFGARVSRPLEQLSSSAARLGAGDFSAALPPMSGIREIDDIRTSLESSALRLDQTLNSERSFIADASHQLRTGLTASACRSSCWHLIPILRYAPTPCTHSSKPIGSQQRSTSCSTSPVAAVGACECPWRLITSRNNTESTGCRDTNNSAGHSRSALLRLGNRRWFLLPPASLVRSSICCSTTRCATAAAT
jgi:HAMP domain-containing protein